MSVRIEQWAATVEVDDVARAAYALGEVQHAEESPEDPIEPIDLWLRHIVEGPSFEQPLRWLAWDGARVVASSFLQRRYVETNREQSWFTIYVHPDERRKGIGRAMFAPLLDAAVADGRTVLRSDAIEGGAGEAFLAHLGLAKKATERKSRLTTANVDRPMMEEWVRKAKERASEYTLVGFDDACPDELLDKWVELTMVMNTAPRDELEMEDWVETPERLREREQTFFSKGWHSWTLIAAHEPTGEFAGFTELAFPPYTDELVVQEGTGVDPKHRDKGLGRWLKAANLLRLLDERPAAKYVDTWNAFSNGPMLGINIAMGFELVRGYAGYQGKAADAAAALER